MRGTKTTNSLLFVNNIAMMMACRIQKLLKKDKWTPALENLIASDLCILRDNLDMTVADMPGGMHPKETDDWAPRRIPGPERGRMMLACDAFIVICRKDKYDVVLNGWRDALREYHIDDRIVAVLSSAEPNKTFSISSPRTDENGVFHADIEGLDRDKQESDLVTKMEKPLRDLIYKLSYIKVADAARAAMSKAFLTGPGGTMYGAAARSATTGRIFTAGQYSSFNHSTNMHAEMNVLSQSAMAGEPDIDVLAVACNKNDRALPCGVCRQVMLEHMQRAKRPFDILSVSSGHRFSVYKMEDLLPHAWGTSSKTIMTSCDSIFVNEELFVETIAMPGAWYLDGKETPNRLKMVLDPFFSPNLFYGEIECEKSDSIWRKVPDAFVDAPGYQRYLTDNHCNDLTYPGAFVEKINPTRCFMSPMKLSSVGRSPTIDLLNELLFAPCGIPIDSVCLTGFQLLTEQAAEPARYDLIVSASPDEIEKLRTRIKNMIRDGECKFISSPCCKLLQKSYPGVNADECPRIVDETRFCEMFQFRGNDISLAFMSPIASQKPAFSAPAKSLGRACVTGCVVSAENAPYIRSESDLLTTEGKTIRILCYNRIGTMLKKGDCVSACGNLYEISQKKELTLLLTNAFVDKMVWLS